MSKGVQEHKMEDGGLGNLASPGHLEESASHQNLSIFYHVTKPVLQQISALSISIDMALPQEASLIPKLCYSSRASRSDSTILRTSRLKHAFAILGALPLGEGGGAKHSPLTGAHENHEKSSKINFPENHQGSSYITYKHSRASLMTPRHHLNHP